MHRRSTVGFAVLALGGLACAGAAAAATPQDVVQALYAEPGLAFGSQGAREYLAQDLSRALSSNTLGFDYRYGASETEISGFALLPQVDNDQAQVVAVFKNFSRPESVNWTLCRASDGRWRVADAFSNTGAQDWDLRQMLGLARDQVRC